MHGEMLGKGMSFLMFALLPPFDSSQMFGHLIILIGTSEEDKWVVG